MRETEFDRDFPRLLLRQPIRIGPSERFDERALAVIHMAGRGENEVFFGHMLEFSLFVERATDTCRSEWSSVVLVLSCL